MMQQDRALAWPLSAALVKVPEIESLPALDMLDAALEVSKSTKVSRPPRTRPASVISPDSVTASGAVRKHQQDASVLVAGLVQVILAFQESAPLTKHSTPCIVHGFFQHWPMLLATWRVRLHNYHLDTSFWSEP